MDSSANKVISNRFNVAVPLYVQIAESLLERIRVGELVPEERLPSERELSKSLNVSRMTLRAALRELDNKGLLIRRPGDGTYVAKPKIERQAAKLVPFTESMRSRGYQASARLIVFERKLAEVSIASNLKIPVSAPVYYFPTTAPHQQGTSLIGEVHDAYLSFPQPGGTRSGKALGL